MVLGSAVDTGINETWFLLYIGQLGNSVHSLQVAFTALQAPDSFMVP